MNIDSIMKWHKERQKFNENFYKEKKYLTTIEKIVDKEIDNDEYRDNDCWGLEIDEMFSFLFNYAYVLQPFCEEIVVKYKDKFISLFEIHGQGCYRRIETLKEEPKTYVNFEDIVKYYETKEKPFRSYAMEIINRSFNMLDIATNGLYLSINEKEIDLNHVRNYIDKNLKYISDKTYKKEEDDKTETEEKCSRDDVINVVDRALDTISTALGSYSIYIDGDKINFDEVRDYVSKNLM